MANVYPGINNYNEYYTNHYFSSIFEENASATISVWRDAARASEELKTPWSLLKECGKLYYTSHDKFLRARSSYQIIPLVKQLADSYLLALGYSQAHPFKATLSDGEEFPVYLEIKKQNGTPLLWVVLSLNKEDEEGVMQGNVFDGDILQENEFAVADVNDSLSAEDAITNALFNNDMPPRWILLIGMNGIALVDRNKWNEKRYLGFDVGTIFSYREDKTLQAMAVLLHKESICPEEGACLLDELDENSHRHAAGVSQDLKYALRESIELLGNEVLYDLKHNKHRNLDTDPVDPGDLTMQCLRYMYRMLFVLFIEARPELGYAPMKEMAYAKGYSLEQLRDVADNVNENTVEVEEGYYFNETISGLFHLIYNGYPETQAEYDEAIKKESVHDTFVVPPLKAHIFDPELTPLLTSAKLRNGVLLKIIRLMSVSRADNRSGGSRISYANLGINQLGSVYESLLSYRGFIAEKDLYEVKKSGERFDELHVGYFVSESDLEQYTEDERVRYERGPDRGKPRMYKKGTFIYRLAGREREKSASYYTPEVLTKCLVKYALKELLVDKTADEILNLTICEPAMGSAAFLNETINQLADAYVDKKQEELGILIPYEKRFNEVQKVKMFIADRNVYGVDLNSTAVELAEVSLWLNTICEGGHIPWFGTQIVNGNSLIGARKQVYRVEQLQTNNPELKWYTKAPDRIAPGETRRGNKDVYHFLVGDPGMCNYTDKVIKSFAPNEIKAMKEWNKNFTKQYNPEDIESLLRLSGIIDTLWKKQIQLRKEVEKKTADKLSIFGHDDDVEESHTTIRQKDYIFRTLYKTEEAENAGPYARLKFAMDYWCALWFWPIEKADLLPDRNTFIFDMSLILEGGIVAVSKTGFSGTFNKNKKTGEITSYQGSLFDDELSETAKEISQTFEDLGKVNLDQLCEQYERLALVREIAKQNHFMHWELEFAELFEERGGFDLLIGNPPWIKLTWNEQDLLSEKNAWFAVRKMSATDTVKLRNKVLQQKDVLASYLDEYVFISGEQNYLNAVTNYPSLKGQQTNLYKCFIPQAFYHNSKTGVSSFVMPEGLFDDPEAGLLRETIYPRLRKHFRFSNAKKLFADVHSSREFGINVYGRPLTEIKFDNIAYLYLPSTLEECYESSVEKRVISLRNKNNERNIVGAKNRILKITTNELELFANIFGGNSTKYNTKLLVLFCNEQLEVLKKIYDNSNLIGSNNNYYTSEFLDETNSQKNGITVRKILFPGSINELVLSGSNIGVANMFYRTPRRICNNNNDYDAIDLMSIDANYLPRSTYDIASKTLLANKIPTVPWNNLPITQYPRLICRKMIDCDGERTLVPCLAPRGVLHTNGVFSFTFKNEKQCIMELGAFMSIVLDFLVKIQGKGNLYSDNTRNLPIFIGNENFSDEILGRTLVLNCISQTFADVWQKQFDDKFKDISFTKLDNKLNFTFSSLSKKWSLSSCPKTDYERRQLLVEIDVLFALLLKLTIEDLVLIYKSQFPILISHEENTWYDSNGRIIYTNNHSLIGVGLDRDSWESIKDMETGTYQKSFIDDTKPGGPVERTITYVAPFTKCDRVEDYKTAWEFFTKKYGEETK